METKQIYTTFFIIIISLSIISIVFGDPQILRSPQKNKAVSEINLQQSIDPIEIPPPGVQISDPDSIDENDADPYIKKRINPPKKYPKKCTNYFNCTLIDELEETHKFLLKNKVGLYTPDKRLEDRYGLFSEYVRLNINSQAMGYLVLYENTKKPIYLKEANDRLTFMYSLPPDLLVGGMFNQNAYTFLYAYQLTGNTSYLDKGINMTQRCLIYDPNDRWSSKLNWGLMCSMVLGKAYKFTNNPNYLQMSRDIVRRTLAYEFPNGLFPHIPDGGPNMAYSTWMMYEMSMNKIDDPNNPDIDLIILKGADFLVNHINPDGSLIYEDQYGVYDSNPANLPSRGDISSLASAAYILRSVGKDAEAQKVLTFLFSQQIPNKNSGAYSDMFPPYSTNSTYNNSTFITNNVSVLRTSLTFWYLSSIASINNHPCTTPEIACTITPGDCNVGFKELDSCNLNASGTNYCINGAYIGCLNKDLITLTERDCEESYTYCDDVCTVTCDFIGPRKCVDSNCTACTKSVLSCSTTCNPGRSCV